MAIIREAEIMTKSVQKLDIVSLKNNANMGLLYNKYFGFFMQGDSWQSASFDAKKSKELFFRLFEGIENEEKLLTTVDNLIKENKRNKKHGAKPNEKITLSFLTSQAVSEWDIQQTGSIGSPRAQGAKQGTKHAAEPLENTINSTIERRKLMLERQGYSLEQVSKRFKATASFMSGIGGAHPTGNSLEFHPTTGTAYLPGSGVKGALKHYIRNLLLQIHEETPNDVEFKENTRFIEHLFGLDKTLREKMGEKVEGENTSQSGNYLFFDALPVNEPNYAIDIMTPHYADWYVKGEVSEAELDKRNMKNTPNDWNDPVPIQFLTVKKTNLEFIILPKNPAIKEEEKQKQKQELCFLFSMLERMLSEQGVGAKTRLGYGTFRAS